MHFCLYMSTVFHMFSCLQIYWQPFYLSWLLKFHPCDWLIEIYLQTEGQGIHHKMASLQPMPGFSPLLGNDKYRMVVRFLALAVESVFTWDIENFVDLCFDVVSFVIALTEKFHKFISVLFLKNFHR